MTVRIYDESRDTAAVLKLWHEALGDRYPIHSAAFLQRLGGNQNYRHGDAVVAVADRRVVGFGLAEIVRPTGAPAEKTAYLAALLVAPAYRRQGLGRALLHALEAHLRQVGCERAAVGRGPARFWTGLPDDLPEAKAFFTAQGYTSASRVCDLLVPLGNYRATMRYQDRLRAIDAQVVSATPALLPALLDFEYREFAGWASAILRLAANGDLGNVLVVTSPAGIIGSILTYTPDTGWRYQNQVWDRLIGGRLGGYGAVGIAKSQRGKGLGAAMCEAAAAYVESRGADACFIDWTAIPDFYQRVGAKVWRWHTMAEKSLLICQTYPQGSQPRG
jgi:GNAT superfamily N-acetyltransferase